MTAKLLSSLVGGGLPAIQASEIKSKTNAPLVTLVQNSGVDATGAGVTYTVTTRCLLYVITVANATNDDTTFRLTDTLSGNVLTEKTSATGSTTSLGIVNALYSLSATTSPGDPAGISAPILCESGFEFYVKTIADNSIVVYLTYLELE